MMQCRDIDELMVEFLYQELEGERLEAFHKHVDGCARCGAEMKSLMRTRQALRELPEAEPSAAVSARLLHEAAKRAPAPERVGMFGWFAKLFGPLAAHPAWAAVASLLLIAGVAGFLRMRAGVDGGLRTAHETSTVSEPATAAAPAAPPAATTPTAAPRDVPVTGADEPNAERARAAAAEAQQGELRKNAEESAAANARANRAEKEVRGPDQAPPAATGSKKVAAPAVVATPAPRKGGGKAADDGFLDEAKADRLGRTATNEEDLKLAAPPPPSPKQEAGDSDRGGVAAAPPPPPAAEPAPAAAQPSAAGGAGYGSTAATEQQADAEADKQRRDEGTRELTAKSKAAAPPSANKPSPAPAPSSPPAGIVAPADSTARYQAAKDAPAEEKAAPAAPSTTTSSTDKRQTQAQAQPKVSPEQELLQLAQKQASAGRCTEALGTRDKIAKMNAEFYRKRVAGDASLRNCEVQTRRKAPARAVEQLESPEADKAAK